jgi:segregation and condensation protein B
MSKENIDYVSVLESVLFMYGREITYTKIGEVLDLEEKEVDNIVKQLQEEYKKRSRSGLRILVSDDKVQMVTSPESAEIIEQITKKELEGPLTPVAMEVLSIIAYRGPISKIDIEAIRGVNCSFSIRNLLRRGLIERVYSDDNRKIQQYQPTIDFLRLLGIENKEELPEFEELSTDKRIDAILYNEMNSQDIEQK